GTIIALVSGMGLVVGVTLLLSLLCRVTLTLYHARFAMTIVETVNFLLLHGATAVFATQEYSNNNDEVKAEASLHVFTQVANKRFVAPTMSAAFAAASAWLGYPTWLKYDAESAVPGDVIACDEADMAARNRGE